ncbi:glycosyltransferase [Methylomarinovum caldicuralii]|uniref:glycosyltransferase n=1 Tax=Methylomarinovum caldicuralii TaxID=438856 RepID=UPI0029556089|nr:glycosyltransferase [Methylomarinovum caldicuralii]
MTLHARADKEAMDLTVIILTINEAIHIERCIRSVKGLARQIFVVDSFSTDNTIDISESLGAVVTLLPISSPFS